MNYIEDYKTECIKTKNYITYAEYLENRLSDEIEKNRQLIEYNKTASISEII